MTFSLLFWLNGHIGFQAKSALLVKPKNIQETKTLTATIESFSKTNTFEERTLTSTRFQDAVANLDEEDHATLLKSVKVTSKGKSGLVTVTSKHAEKDVALLLTDESVETLRRMTRLYLASENELELITLDQAITKKSIVEPVSYSQKSIVTALILFFLILVLRPLGEKVKTFFSKKKEDEVSQYARDQRFVPQKLDPAFLYTPSEDYTPQPKARDQIQAEEYGGVPKGGLQSVSVSMEDLPFSFEGQNNEQGEVEPVQIEPAGEEKEVKGETELQEPTVIEYKRRLNELLSQK